MKRINNILFIGFLAIFLFSCKPKITTRKIIEDPRTASNFAHQELIKFISENPGASVVVRDPLGGAGAVSGSFPTSRVCAIIEQGLMRRNYQPRDRLLFENTLQRMEAGSDYAQLYEQTRTDLIFEITHFNVDRYVQNSFFDQFGMRHQFLVPITKKASVPHSYVLFGFSIEIKVILLRENLIAGTFRYFHVPCTEGCTVEYFDTQGMRFRAANSHQTQVAPEISRQTSVAPSDEAVSNFIFNVVIPSMFREMGEQTASVTPSATPGTQTAAQNVPTAVDFFQGNQTPNVPAAIVPSVQAETGLQEAGTATIYLYRLHTNLEYSHKVFSNNDLVFRYGGFGRDKTSTQVTTFGPSTLRAKRLNYALFWIPIPHNSNPLIVNIEPGGEYFIRSSFKFGGKPTLRLMPEMEGKAEFYSIR